MPEKDTLDRPLQELRISVTDRCNFRCVYCMPKEVFGPSFAFAPRSDLLTFEEIERVAAAFVTRGVDKIRITGGEPLLRRDLERLIAMLARLDLRDLTLTTNGSLLDLRKARALRDAGLLRISISLDSLDDQIFRRMNDVAFPVARVLEAIEAAAEAGLSPIKIDVVVKRGQNDQGIVAMAEHFRHSGHVLRFIEYMDVGNTNRWEASEVVSGAEIVTRIAERWKLEPVTPAYFGEVASRWRYADGGGEIGIITAITQPFCSTCTRARLSATGEVFTCLFGTRGTDLRQLVRDGASDAELQDAVGLIWRQRNDRYSEIRSEETRSRGRVEMSRIGG